MNAPVNRRIIAAALLAAASGGTAAADSTFSSSILLYGLGADPLSQQSVLASRWASPSLSLRLDSAVGLGAHELRILSTGTPALAPGWQSAFDAFDMPNGYSIEPMRATYRYTLLADPHWAMKLGLSANLRDAAGVLRPGLSAESQQFASLPLLHVAGVGHWSPRWRLDFALDGLMTGRGRALDLGVQLNYRWSPSMSLFGGYQLTDAAGDAEGFYGSGLSNRANIGLRLRF